MGLNIENLSQAAHMFRSQIYSDEKSAVVREYFCNAIDEHVSHKIDRLVELTLNNSYYIVRDFAKGLPRDLVESVFFQYLASTKTGDEHGGFGIGAKAALAYSDIFYVTSFHDGVATEYAGFLEDTGGLYPEGKVNILSTYPTEETGIEVKVPIKSNELHLFEDRIRDIARFSKNKFLYNGDEVGGEIPQEWTELGNCLVKQNGMGNVRVRLGDITYATSKHVWVCELTPNIVILADSVNDCSVPPSRESIKEDPKTTLFLDTKIKEFKDSFEAEVLKKYNAANTLLEKTKIKRTFKVKPDDWKMVSDEIKELLKDVAVSAYSKNSKKYCGITDCDDTDFFQSFHKVNYFINTGLSKKKKLEYIEYHRNVKDRQDRTLFVQFETEKEGLDWAEKLGIPIERIQVQSEIEFFKAEKSERSVKFKIFKVSEGSAVSDCIRWATRKVQDDDTNRYLYVECFHNKPSIKYPASFYEGLTMVAVPSSYLKKVPSNWVKADDFVTSKIEGLRKKLLKDKSKYINYKLVRRNGALLRSYMETLDKPVPKDVPVDGEVLKFWSFLPETKKINLIIEQKSARLEEKTDNWQFRAIQALRYLDKNEFELAKAKIIN